MDWMIVAVFVLGIPIALVVWLMVRARSARESIEDLTRRVLRLEAELARVGRREERRRGEDARPEGAAAARASTPGEPAGKEERYWEQPRPDLAPPEPVLRSLSVPPLLPSHPLAPPPIPKLKPETASEPARAAESIPRINWEQFMGVKMFASIGGMALFLGVAFFVKYSFENNLVPPELRVALGYLAALGLLVGGGVMSQKNYAVLSQTLCATGLVILYAVTFACKAVYHFQFFGPLPAFLLMVLITVTAFLLAVRLNALVSPILGMLGGFLTPILLSTGQDNPFGLFGYIAILDAGLLVVALHRRWFFLAALAAAGTVFMKIGWAGKFFKEGKYFEEDKILIPLGVLLGFNLLYLGPCWWAKRREQTNRWFWGSNLALAAVGFAFTAWFLTFAPLAQRPWLMFSFVFFIDLVITALVLLDDEIAPAHPIAGLAVFGLLALWTANSLSNELLNAALVFYFVFAVMHTVFPLVRQRLHGVSAPSWESQIFPPLALVLALVPTFRLPQGSFLVWPFVLLMDVLAIGLAVMTVSILPVLVVLVLTLGATGALIFKVPATLTGLPASFFLLAAFAVFFVAAGVWLARKFKPEPGVVGARIQNDLLAPAHLSAQLPAIAAVLPFLLLIIATLRLPLDNPSPVFGLALLLVVLLLGVTKLFSFDWMPAIGLACLSALECAWHFNWFEAPNASLPLIWYLLFLFVFALFPFLFLRQFSDKVVPWAAAAMSGPPQFFLIHRLVAAAYLNRIMGLLPAAFSILPLLSLVVVLREVPAANPARLTQLAWFGGVALFFITLIFPIQFERQWITIGWALEGAALLWLFHRVPHPGLRMAGVGLLVAAFVRLALNREVFGYHPRAATPILNCDPYAYGLVTVCLFAGARLLAPPRNRISELNAPPLLAGLGTVLAFLLLNIEIADYFSAPGSTLAFEFGGNFAREMTYTISWALFALVMIVVGIVKK